MKYEYFIFNIVVLSGPLLFTFHPKIAFYRKWKYALPAIFITAIPFIIWDLFVTGQHWWFNSQYISGIHILGLPVEEILFFVTVPYACLFIWEGLKKPIPKEPRLSMQLAPLFLIAGSPLGLSFFFYGKEYTGLMLLSMSAIAILDVRLKTGILFQPRTYWFVIIVTALTLMFNGYLTARPVVLYEESYQLGFRIFSIPVEDFGFGFALLLTCTIIYEKLKIIKLAGANPENSITNKLKVHYE